MSTFDNMDLKTEINTVSHVSDVPMKTLNQSSKLDSSKIFNDQNVDSAEVLPKSIIRPHTLEDFKEKEGLTHVSNLKSSLLFNELNEDEELWILDIPMTVDAMQLKGQVLHLGDKSKFKIGSDRYFAINKDNKSSLTCVVCVNDNPQTYETVNIKPAGAMNVRRKLSTLSKKPVQFEKTTEGVPYPPNLKVRHPLFGVKYEEIVQKPKKER